jgi:4'-phosphopantetheinyl transferase
LPTLAVSASIGRNCIYDVIKGKVLHGFSVFYPPKKLPCNDETGSNVCAHPLPMSHKARATNLRDIDIWLTYYDEIVDDRQLAGLRSLLSVNEVAQEGRFHFADDRKRYMITRAMVRTILSRYVRIAPEHWVFSKNAYGRPMIAPAIVDMEVQARGLFFNLSHTRGLIALAVTRGRELGVDVENIATRSVSLDVAKRFFSPTEVAELSRVAPDRQQDRFFEYWTLKEAYIKARGMGLLLPLDRFSFSFPRHNMVDISIDPDLQDHADRWSFWQYRPKADYLMALCAERFVDDEPVISMRKFTPLSTEMPVIAPALRRSEAR